MSKDDKALATQGTVAAVAQNKELMQMYRENASVGARNLQGKAPTLKIHTQGKSTTNEMPDGSDPKDGWFFHSLTQEQFEKLECHVLSISRGFRTEVIDQKTKMPKRKPDGSIETKFNQLMAGVITNDDRMLPFIMYLTGLKLNPMWEFGKEIHKYTKHKDTPIPIFALHTVVTAKQVEHDYGKSWIPVFSYQKTKDGEPVVVTDPGKFVFLKDTAVRLEEMMEDIASRGVGEDESTEDQPPHPADDSYVDTAKEAFGVEEPM